MNLVDRVKKLLVSPTQEWGVIKDEEHTVAGLYTHYVMILAAIPAVATFIGWSVIGYGGLVVGLLKRQRFVSLASTPKRRTSRDIKWGATVRAAGVRRVRVAQ